MHKIVTAHQNNVTVDVSGHLYMEEASALRDELLELFAQGHKHFNIHLRGLENMDTTGLGVFISLYKRTHTVGGDVIIHGAAGPVRELFTLTGMDQIFTLVDY